MCSILRHNFLRQPLWWVVPKKTKLLASKGVGSHWKCVNERSRWQYWKQLTVRSHTRVWGITMLESRYSNRIFEKGYSYDSHFLSNLIRASYIVFAKENRNQIGRNLFDKSDCVFKLGFNKTQEEQTAKPLAQTCTHSEHSVVCNGHLM